MSQSHNRMQTQLQLQHNASLRLVRTIHLANMLNMTAGDILEYLSKAADLNPALVFSSKDPQTFPVSTSAFRNSAQNVSRQSDLISVLTVPQKGQTISEYLSEAICFLPSDETYQRCCRYIIENLDNNGYFYEPEKTAASHLGVTADFFSKCRHQIQTIDSLGLASRDLQEYLMFQLQLNTSDTTLAQTIVRDHLNLISVDGSIRLLVDTTDSNISDVRKAVHLIQSLNTRPANGFFDEVLTNYIIPDAYLYAQSDHFSVVLSKDYDLSIDQYYTELVHSSDRNVERFVSRCLRQANELIESLSQRESLIVQVFSIAASIQSEYLNGGAKKPLLQKELAEMLHVNRSSISRIVRGKYLCYQGTCFPADDLFSRPIASDTDTSQAQIQSLIRSLTDDEDRLHPLTDDELRNKLESMGYQLSRRLVAKYRLSEGIPSSFKRKEDSLKGSNKL